MRKSGGASILCSTERKKKERASQGSLTLLATRRVSQKQVFLAHIAIQVFSGVHLFLKVHLLLVPVACIVGEPLSLERRIVGHGDVELRTNALRGRGQGSSHGLLTSYKDSPCRILELDDGRGREMDKGA